MFVITFVIYYYEIEKLLKIIYPTIMQLMLNIYIYIITLQLMVIVSISSSFYKNQGTNLNLIIIYIYIYVCVFFSLSNICRIISNTILIVILFMQHMHLID